MRPPWDNAVLFGLAVQSAPSTGTRAHDAPKEPRKMGLIGKPAIECDLRERSIRSEHDFLSALDATAHDVGVRGLPDHRSESAGKMRRAQVGDGREVSESDGVREIGIDEAGDSVHLPRSEAGFTQGAAGMLGPADCVGIRRQKAERFFNALTALVLVSREGLVSQPKETNDGGN